MLGDYKDRLGTSQPFLLHRLFEGFDLGEVAVFVGADEEEPLVEVERPPGGMWEADGAAVGALDAGAQGVERGARLGQARERVGERERAGRTDALGRFVLSGARALDELFDGDGVEVVGGGPARARLLGLTQKFVEQRGDIALDDGEMLDQLCD